MAHQCTLFLSDGLDVRKLTGKLHGLFEDEEEIYRSFQGDYECITFFRRVKNGDAQAKAFKEFPYTKYKPWTVEREIWYRDFAGTVEERKYVIVHIHFSDLWDERLSAEGKKQNVTLVTQMNLRHFPTTKGSTGAGAYETMFESAYLEQQGTGVLETHTRGSAFSLQPNGKRERIKDGHGEISAFWGPT